MERQIKRIIFIDGYKGGRPVPADENGLDALIEAKYQL